MPSTGPAEGKLPGVAEPTERQLFEEIFAGLGASPVCIGFPHRAGDFGIGPATREMQPGLVEWYYAHPPPLRS